MAMAIDSPAPSNSSTAAVSSAAAAARMSQLAESLKLEHYRKTILAHARYADREVAAVLASVGPAAEVLSREDAVVHLNSLVTRLQGLKRKLEEGNKTENEQAQRCQARLDHLEGARAENLVEWNDTKLKHILIDYMLCMSYYDTAVKLAKSSNIEVCFSAPVNVTGYRILILQNFYDLQLQRVAI